jgi:hypothetical protein
LGTLKFTFSSKQFGEILISNTGDIIYAPQNTKVVIPALGRWRQENFEFKAI